MKSCYPMDRHLGCYYSALIVLGSESWIAPSTDMQATPPITTSPRWLCHLQTRGMGHFHLFVSIRHPFDQIAIFFCDPVIGLALCSGIFGVCFWCTWRNQGVCFWDEPCTSRLCDTYKWPQLDCVLVNFDVQYLSSRRWVHGPFPSMFRSCVSSF